MSEMAVGAQQPELYYDVQEGRLLVGQLAIDSCIEAGADPSNIFKLSNLLTAKERVVKASDFEPVKFPDWTHQDDISAVQWINNVTQQAETPKVVSEESVIRAGYMGLAPRHAHFKSLPNGLSGLYRDAGIEGTRVRGLFDNWTMQNYVDYINGLCKRFGGKPTFEQFKAASKEVGNPSLKHIQMKFEGGLPSLYELAGFPNIKSWSEEDYIRWGVRFMLANDGLMPTAPNMVKLSALKRGPHPTSIYDNVGSIMHFQTVVMQEHDHELERRKLDKEQKLMSIDGELTSGDFPVELTEIAESDDELIAIAARYRLIRYLLPRLEEKYTRQNSIIKRSDWLVRAIQRADPLLTAADIETAAMELHVFDDIWPMDSYMQDLKLPA